MDPISIALGVVGLGMQIFGGSKQVENAGAEAKVSQDEARQEQNINDLKQQQMEIDARRQQTQIIRNVQQAQALGLQRATNQNAQFGSGLAGGQGNATSQGLFNLQGVNDALSIGRGINTFNQNISSDKIQMAGLQSSDATAKGITSLGGALITAGPTIGKISQGFSPGGGLFGGGGASGSWGSPLQIGSGPY